MFIGMLVADDSVCLAPANIILIPGFGWHHDMETISASDLLPYEREIPWWCHQMEKFSALLSLCVGDSPVTGKFPLQRPVTRGFVVFFDLCLTKQLSKPSRRWWFETPSRPLWRHCNECRALMFYLLLAEQAVDKPSNCRWFETSLLSCIKQR